MRILLIHQYFTEENDAGGSRFNEMTKIWAEQGHEITVIAGMIHDGSKKRPEYKGKFFVHKQHDKVSVWRSHVSELYNVSFRGRLWSYFSFVISSSWTGLFKVRSKFDLILVTSPPLFLGITAIILSKLKRIPFAFEVRDLWPESAIDIGVVSNKLIIRLAYWLEKFIYRKASLISVLTPAFCEILIKKKNVPKEKLVFLPNAADFSMSDEVLSDFDRTAFRQELGIDDNFVIVYVGAHGLANHLIQLLETAELLRDTNVLFLLIGSGMQKPMLMEEADNRKLKNIRFIDPIPKRDVLKYIIASDLGTSVLKRVDTFKTIYSNKTFDYMSCKTSILLLIDGISRDLVEKADCGVFAEPENTEDIAVKIRECMSDGERLLKQGDNGYRFAKRHFDRNIIAGKYITSLSSIKE
ncbi:MAG: glycosyltransferase family 4 protein [Bacteroidales bacterium]|nr:glycosyltransferase family 4 protein [Bacteroidales bacterium]